ncbi:MAG: hypothetical protein KatS3mg060_2610 [Dehalococcoidia bacterium]|nr:MAG: hypothetical protein KatS3mg060_2610 [Dehalococcoidia bacterium]
MAIDALGFNLTRLAASHAYGISAPAGTPSSPPETRPAPKRDGVELSATAREVHLARAAVATLPDVRAERIAALKEAVASGTYQVSSAVLAQKLLGRA